MYTRCRNIVSESEELLINQNQLPYSKTIVLILRHRILNALKRMKGDPRAKGIEERINEPANPDHKWRFRLHIDLSKLQDASSLNAEIYGLLKDSRRFKDPN